MENVRFGGPRQEFGIPLAHRHRHAPRGGARLMENVIFGDTGAPE